MRFRSIFGSWRGENFSVASFCVCFQSVCLVEKRKPDIPQNCDISGFSRFFRVRILLFPLSLKYPAALERVSFQNRSQSQKEHIHCLLLLLILFPFEDTRCLYRTESECHEHCRTHAQEPVCHGVVSGLGQVDCCVGRICTGAGLRVNGVNVQHIAVFVSQRNFASFL